MWPSVQMTTLLYFMFYVIENREKRCLKFYVGLLNLL